MLHKVGELASERLLGQLAAARGGGIVDDAEFRREGDLAVAGASGDVEELPAVELPLGLGDRWLEELGGHRSHEASDEAGAPLDDAESLPVLGHRTLALDFARRDEVVAELRHQLARAADHRRVAVDARVHRTAESVGRIHDKGDDVVGEVDDAERNAKGECGLLGGCGTEERRAEAHRLDLRAGTLKDLDRQLAVESSAHQAQAPARHAHLLSHQVARLTLTRLPLVGVSKRKSVSRRRSGTGCSASQRRR